MYSQIPTIFSEKISPEAREKIAQCKDFVERYCIPADKIYLEQISPDREKRWKEVPEIIGKLKTEARKRGLWNMFLSNKYSEGAGYTNLEYGCMAEHLGRSIVAPSVTNNNAPDTGNMEILARYGTKLQKEKWLNPLLDGAIRSAFLMTEKGTSSSNALNISCSAKLNSRGKYVINGVKWFASGSGDPNCAVWLVMCKTDSSKSTPYANHTVLLIDSKRALASGNAKLVRPLTVFGYDEAPHGHCEIVFEDYEVTDADNSEIILHKLGGGFEVIQSRLGPGRIHHCMRTIGVAEQALLTVAHRANNRLIFGTRMSERESFKTAYSQYKIDVEKCRILVLNAAHTIDVKGPKGAMREIAMAKIEVPRKVLQILDWCIQMFGAEGVSQDTPLARAYAETRTLRIADGPDEAHLGQLARNNAKDFPKIEKYFEELEQSRLDVAKL